MNCYVFSIVSSLDFDLYLLSFVNLYLVEHYKLNKVLLINIDMFVYVIGEGYEMQAHRMSRTARTIFEDLWVCIISIDRHV